MCLIPGSIDVDGLVMLLVSNGESSFVVSVHPYCYIFGCYSMSLSACLVIPDGCCCFVQFSFCGLVLVYLLCLFGINEFYVHGTVHLSNTSFIKYQRDATYSVYLVYFYNSTCFGRSPRPSSGVIFYKL